MRSRVLTGASGPGEQRSGVVDGARSEPQTARPEILFVCTGNLCRSPMAAGLLAAHAGTAPVSASSAGFVTEGLAPPAVVVDLMRELGVDVAGHRSRVVDGNTVARADLVVGMTRQHAVELALLAGPGWTRCFTYADLVRRAGQIPPWLPPEPIDGWVDRVHGDRSKSGLLRLPLSDDVPDPMGGSIRDFEEVRDTLVGLTEDLAQSLGSA